jgi:hypothetical protein
VIFKRRSSRLVWDMTAGCTANRSHGASKDFCDLVDEIRHGIGVADETLNVERPASGDETASELAWMTGLAIEKKSKPKRRVRRNVQPTDSGDPKPALKLVS